MKGDLHRTSQDLTAAVRGLFMLFVAIQPIVAPQEDNLVFFDYFKGFASKNQQDFGKLCQLCCCC